MQSILTSIVELSQSIMINIGKVKSHVKHIKQTTSKHPYWWLSTELLLVLYYLKLFEKVKDVVRYKIHKFLKHQIYDFSYMRHNNLSLYIIYKETRNSSFTLYMTKSSITERRSEMIRVARRHTMKMSYWRWRRLS